MQRYFAKSKINNNLILNNNDIHHIKNVMRLKPGSKIEVVYNKKLYICKIDLISNSSVDISVIDVLDNDNETSINITVAFPIIKEDKIDLILQKCTELGVSKFIPLELSRCVVKYSKEKINKKINRWITICKEAAEQSKRNIIPEVSQIMSIKDLINLEYDLKIVCSVNQNISNIKKVLQNNKKCDKIIFVVGPEGGLSENEETYLVNNGFIRASLGKSILRCETAPITVCSMIKYEYME